MQRRLWGHSRELFTLPIKVLKLIKAENGVESNDDWMTEDQVKENMGI